MVRGDRESSAVRDFAACTTDHFSLFMNPESTQTDFVKLFQEECFRMRAIATTEVSLQSVISKMTHGELKADNDMFDQTGLLEIIFILLI